MDRRTGAILKLNIAVVLAGATGLFGRMISLSELPLVWYRMVFAVILLAGMMAFSKSLHIMPFRHMAKIVGCGAILSLHWLFFYGSIKASNVSVGVICFAAAGFFTALLEPLVNRHGASLKQIVFSSIALAGIMMVFSLDTRYRTGILMGVFSASMYSVFSIFHKNVAGETGQGSGTMLLYELAGGVILLGLFMPFYHAADPLVPVVPALRDLVMLLLLSSVFTVLPLFLQIQALRTLSPFLVNITYNLESVYSIFFAMLLFGESRDLSLSFWAGVSLVVLSVLLEVRRYMGQVPSGEEPEVPERDSDRDRDVDGVLDTVLRDFQDKV